MGKTTWLLARNDRGRVWNTYQTKVQFLVAALTAAGFDSGVPDEQLHQRIQESTARETIALGLRDRIADLEVAVDTL